MSFEYQGTCICGGQVSSFFKKPTTLTPTVTKSQCKKCLSKYLVKISIVKGSNPRRFSTDVDVIEITKKAKLASKKSILKGIEDAAQS